MSWTAADHALLLVDFVILPLIDGDDQMGRSLFDRVGLAAVLGLKTFDDRTRIDPRRGDIERVAGRLGRFVGIGDGAADDLLDPVLTEW